MKFGVGLMPYHRWSAPEELARVVVEADALGYDYVTLSDHVVVPVGPELPRSGVVFPEVGVLAAYLAARTTRIRFVFHALVVPLRDPVLCAKELATLDWVSGGRLDVVVGTGWLASEFEALGVPYADRGRRTDGYLRVMKALWTQENPEFRGEYVDFGPVHFAPRCVQDPHVPLWIGGTGSAPFRRVVELGDGWAPMVGTLEERAAAIRDLKEQARAAGRDPGALAFVGNLTVGTLDAQSEKLTRGHHATERDRRDALRRAVHDHAAARREVEAHAVAGFTHLGVSLGWDDVEELLRGLRSFADGVIGPLRSAP